MTSDEAMTVHAEAIHRVLIDMRTRVHQRVTAARVMHDRVLARPADYGADSVEFVADAFERAKADVEAARTIIGIVCSPRCSTRGQ